jgi:hypothetical protein
MARATARGIQARGVPGAQVRHLVRRYQTELPEMLQRAERAGRGWAIVRASSGRTFRRRLATAAGVLPGLVAPKARPSGPDAASFEKLWRRHWRRGALMGALFGPFPPTAEPADRTRARVD